MSSPLSPPDVRPSKSLPTMCFFGATIGVIAGVGAWFFRLLIGTFHNLLFLGELSFTYDANVHTPPSPWGAAVILVPPAGAIVVVWLVKTFAPEAKGHGVPEVMDAIHYQQGRIRPVVAVVKSLASAICIGSGGSVGREGPIIQIGSAFGSALGQFTHLPTRQIIVLISAGAAGGIAATFNAPLGGIVFAIELLLVSINVRSLLPVGISTVVACYLGRALIGMSPAFNFPPLQSPSFELSSPWTLILCMPFGVVMGLVSVAFVRGLYWAEDRFDALPVNDYVRHVAAMTVVGVIMYVLHMATGHYYIQGVGYATIMDLIRGVLTSPTLIVILFLCKLVVTCLTLGSGGSGGVFSPALFMGATCGALCAHLLAWLLPSFEISHVFLVLAGMAAAIAGTTGAIVTSAVMVLEMTDDVNVTLPIVLTSVFALGVRKWISPESVYTLKLIRRDHVVPEGLQAALLDSRRVSDVMHQPFRVLPSTATWSPFSGTTIVFEDHRIRGVIRGAPSRQDDPQKLLANCEGKYVVATPLTPLTDCLRQMHAEKAWAIVVVRVLPCQHESDVVGVVTDRELADWQRGAANLLEGGRVTT